MTFETKAQVLLAGVVVHEDSGNVTEGQARANVETSFAGQERHYCPSCGWNPEVDE